MHDGLPDRQPVIRVTTMPADTNPYGDIFGGWLIGHMDQAAGLVASYRCGGRAVTIAIDAVTFHHPVAVGDEVSIYATVQSIGRSSMRIGVQAWQRGRNARAARMVTEAVFTFVALDDDRRPRQIDAVPEDR